jgi:hypothetical protein
MSEWYDFYRQAEFPEPAYDFAIIDDNKEPLAGRGYDFLAQQCASAAFDQIPIPVDFIGAIDRKIDFFYGREWNDADS